MRIRGTVDQSETATEAGSTISSSDHIRGSSSSWWLRAGSRQCSNFGSTTQETKKKKISEKKFLPNQSDAPGGVKGDVERRPEDPALAAFASILPLPAVSAQLPAEEEKRSRHRRRLRTEEAYRRGHAVFFYCSRFDPNRRRHTGDRREGRGPPLLPLDGVYVSGLSHAEEGDRSRPFHRVSSGVRRPRHSHCHLRYRSNPPI